MDDLSNKGIISKEVSERIKKAIEEHQQKEINFETRKSGKNPEEEYGFEIGTVSEDIIDRLLEIRQ